MSRIVQLANVTSTSGGLRTVLDHLATGYAVAGHEVVRIVPGPRYAVSEHAWGRCVHLPAHELPGTGHRVLTDLRRVQRELGASAPDRVEVHDRTTLRSIGPWARAAGVPSLVVSHERLDRWLRQWLSPRLPLDRLADRSNSALAASFDHVVCTTGWAEQEFNRLHVPVRRVPLGVDVTDFPAAPERDGDGTVRLVLVGRLSREKRPDLAIGATRELQRRGHRVTLRIAGGGPLRRALAADSAGAPVELLGVVPERTALAAELGRADFALAPGPAEAFGLAALEALACGTPVVANVHSALPELLGDAGAAAASTPRSFADAVERLLLVPADGRRRRARRQAEAYPWSRTVDGFLRVHCLPLGAQRSGARAA